MSKKQNQDEVQTVADVTLRLIDARQKLQDGWTRGEYKKEWANGDVSYCMLGAIGFSNDHEPDNTSYLTVPYITKETNTTLVSGWNDEPLRTQEEVLSVMDKAIARSMNRG